MHQSVNLKQMCTGSLKEVSFTVRSWRMSHSHLCGTSKIMGPASSLWPVEAASKAEDEPRNMETAKVN